MTSPPDPGAHSDPEQPRPVPPAPPQFGSGLPGLEQADEPWQRLDGPSAPAPAPDPHGGWRTEGLVFAGVLMLCQGVLAALQGVAGLVGDPFYEEVADYTYRISLTGWGVIHLVLGVAVAVTGAGILRRARWARLPGLFFAALSLVAQFLFLPYQPVWSIIVIALDVFIIWALASAPGGGAGNGRRREGIARPNPSP
ncbi:hypothetical protein AB0O03_16755 [Streptomyces diastaticus]|uniref:DUF7144 family membrane protein n=1 Tax=Streptomyces TaxID=1883 RepID=UPI0018AD0788|nr:hypothetical protein [Streptomyces sp. BRB081]MBL3805883.1 hypothetical protein [Streptomyces sp. BRB081]